VILATGVGFGCPRSKAKVLSRLRREESLKPAQKISLTKDAKDSAGIVSVLNTSVAIVRALKIPKLTQLSKSDEISAER
jgi:hypothetical protein